MPEKINLKTETIAGLAQIFTFLYFQSKPFRDSVHLTQQISKKIEAR
jgi:hypothetical protein